MWLRILSVTSQITIIILAIVIVITMSKKQLIDSTFTSFEYKINAQLTEDRKRVDEKINTVQANLDRYQLNREQRAAHFTAKLDELYALYKQDPSRIASTNTPTIISAPEANNNFIYLETKLNKLDEKIDKTDNRLSSKVSIIEKKVEGIQLDKSIGQRIINNNIQTNNR
ncbi:MAG: hypothetical protein EOO06_01120 [Chitinophagaceae bacterium]|nr:MAG: hypothetical protein EOO06_01120 [Chitinophagaceae bacterium]